MNTSQSITKTQKAHAHGMSYRPDIDGLRAIAVLVVIAFHMQTPLGPFGGGYVGVDVFFVISGYLISSLVSSEIRESRFSYKDFYERRIRRIVPALFFMLFLVSIWSYLFLLPSELEDYSKSLLAAVLSGSNFYFWRHSGYFDSPLSNPLLHTWSLAVEEQFYVLLPIFLASFRKAKPGTLRLAVCFLAAISFAVSVGETHRDTVSAYYMLYSRAWELLLGTMLALKVFPQITSKYLRNLAGFIGLGAILIAVHWYSKVTLFPGLAALLPCIGACLIIAAGEAGPTLVGRALSLRPVVFVGLISYSLYLWHWPLIVFKSMGVLYGNDASHRTNMILIFGLSILCATFSWWFVERPFRIRRGYFSGTRLFRFAFASTCLLSALALTAIEGRGFPFRFPPKAAEVAAYVKVPRSTFRKAACFITPPLKFANYDPGICLRESDTRKNYLLVGDSHSAAIWHSLAILMPGINVMEAAASACKPFTDQSPSPDCDKLMDYVFKQFIPTHHVDCLLVTGRWEEGDIPALNKLALWAKTTGTPVVLIGPVPEYELPLPRLLAISIVKGDPQYAYNHRVLRLAGLDLKLQSLASNVWHMRYISMIQSICNEHSCLEYADGQRTIPLMFDADHLSESGSLRVIGDLLAAKALP